jgi:hypothetical protein
MLGLYQTKLKPSRIGKETINTVKVQSQSGRKYLQAIHLTEGSYPEYIKNLKN